MSEKPSATLFNCPSCSAPLSVRGLGQTSTYGCPSCGSIIDIRNPQYQILQKASKNPAKSPIELGTRATFKGKKYELIGYMVRSDSSREYYWDEYLLFNPYEGFAWLMEFNGHWNFILSIKDEPRLTSTNTVEYQNRSFKLFINDSAIVTYVVGEFYWQVKTGDTVSVRDYISPPYTLSLETEPGEKVWSLGEYLTPQQVKEAFNFKNELPRPRGVGAGEVFGPEPYFYTSLALAIIFSVLMIFIHLGIEGSKKPHTIAVFSENLGGVSGEPLKAQTTQTFDIHGAVDNVSVKGFAPVNNSWVYMDLALVNADTGEDEDTSSLELSYYQGQDSDGRWTEGSTTASALFSEVPPGKYYLSIESSSGPLSGTVPVTLTLTRGVGYYGNILIALLLVWIYPLILLARRYSFEAKRWSESSYPWSDN